MKARQATGRRPTATRSGISPIHARKDRSKFGNESIRRNELAKAALHSEIVGASARAREMSVDIRSDSIRVAVETTSCTLRVYQKGPWQAKAWQVVVVS